jgi:stage V sporulation protein B
MGVLRGFFQGKNTMIPTAVSQLLEQVVNAVVSIAAAFLLVKNFSTSASVASYGAAGGTLGTFVGAVTGLLFLVFVFIVYKPVLNRHMRRDPDDYRESYKSIFGLLVITIVPIILSQTVYQISGILDGTMFNYVMSGKHLTLFDMDALKTTIANNKITEDTKSAADLLYIKDYREALMGIYGTKYKLLQMFLSLLQLP